MTKRHDQLVSLRDRLNKLGNCYYASSYGCLYVRPDQFNERWNQRRITVRNKINKRLRDA